MSVLAFRGIYERALVGSGGGRRSGLVIDA
jgi:hypothetical protein